MRQRQLDFFIQSLILISLFLHEVTGLKICGPRSRINLIELNLWRKTNEFWRQYNRFDTRSTIFSNDKRYEGPLDASEALNSKALISTLQSMFVISGPLGMLLDNQHGKRNVELVISYYFGPCHSILSVFCRSLWGFKV